MEIKADSDLAKGFTTTVGIVSSRGSLGDNLMAAEWTYLVSYNPAMITVHIGHRRSKATAENIKETGVFGVSLASTHQNIVSSIIGNHTGHDVDKVAVLAELGYTFMRGEATQVLLSKEAVFMAECKLVNIEPMGDHTMFLGEVVAAQEGTSNDPLLYNRKKYWKIGENVIKPSDEERERFKNIILKHQKTSTTTT